MTRQSLLARLRATGRLWNTLLVATDIAVVVLATQVAYFARFEGPAPEPFASWVWPLAAVASILTVGSFIATGLYRLVLRYVGVDVLVRMVIAIGSVWSLLIGISLFVRVAEYTRPVPIGVLFIQAVLVFLGCAATRLAARVLLYLRVMGATSGRKVLIIGAGSAGSLLLREIHARPDLGLTVMGFLDDDRALRRHTVGGVRVLGSVDTLEAAVNDLGIVEILVALPSAPRERVRDLLNTAADLGIETRVMPPIVIAKGSVSLRDLRPADVEDLLGREPTPIDVEQVRETITGKVVAVTGAAGSIGSELCRQVAAMEPSRLLLLEVDETRLYELWLELEKSSPGVSLMRICDVRDRAKLDVVFSETRPDVVLHAAAYKHVPLMELEPSEAIRTNVGGTLNVIDACRAHSVGRFVLISTDKAVSPVNIMGLSKRLAERVMLQAADSQSLTVVAVRFGNVLASRGSVIPIFEEQLRRGGPLTVTDPEVTRYFMTIPEASRLVLQAQAIGNPGDTFVLEMGEPVLISDLARKMIALSGVPADIEFTGLRPGEKLHEVLVEETECLLPTEREKILRVDRVSVSDDGFDLRVSLLLAAADAGDTEGLMSAIAALEPGFAYRAISA